MSFDLTHARHDPAHCLTPGLFRSLKRGERKKAKLDVTHTIGDDSIRFWGPEPLGADDLRILQGLIAMSAISGEKGRGIMLRSGTNSEAGQHLRLLLNLQWDAIEQDALVVKGSFSQLAREVGYAEGGSQIKVIRESIERLYAISIIVDRNGLRQGYRLLSEYASDENGSQLFVALNPRITDAILSRRQHTRINMNEVRALQTDPARLIHQRLCGWIDPGKSRRVILDKVCGYVWPDKSSAAAMRQRHVTARRALGEIDGLGWTVNEYAKAKYDIGRPKD